MNNLKILHIVDSLRLGGAESLVANTIISLPKSKHQVVVLELENDFVELLREVDILSLNFSKRTKLITCAWKLRSIIIKNGIDIVHAHLFWSTLIARIACFGLGVKFIFSLHTIMSKDSFNKSWLMKAVEKITYTKNQIVIGVSQTVLKDYNEVIGLKGDYYTLYNYVEDAFFTDTAVVNTQKNHYRIVAVGNIKPVKNYDYLIEVFRKLGNAKFSLDIYGKGIGSKSLKEKVKKLGLDINLKGQCSKLHLVLPKYDLYIMPSLYEGFGIAPLEAMAAGLPVLLSEIDTFEELAGSVAFFFNPIDPNSLVNLLNRISMNEVDLQLAAIECRKRANQIGRKEQYFESLNNIYLSQIN